MNLHCCVSPWSEARAIARCLRRLSRPRCLRTARPKCPYPLGPGRSQHRLCSTPHQGEEQPARGQDASGTVAFQDERCLFSLLLARLLACGRSRVLFCDGRLLTLAKAPCGHPQSDEARATGEQADSHSAGSHERGREAPLLTAGISTVRKTNMRRELGRCTHLQARARRQRHVWQVDPLGASLRVSR